MCVGDPVNGGRDACFGDSGGPLAADIDRRRVQVGVVSWGPGCGLRNTVGVYTSIGYFEDWIRRNVPDAVFVSTAAHTPPPRPVSQPSRPTTPPLAPTPAPGTQTAAATEPCGLPAMRSANAGVKVEVVEGHRLRIGTAIHITSTPAVSGQLLVFNVDTQTCRTYQVFPNKFSPDAGVGSITAAGATVSIPAAGNSFTIRAGAPAGPNRIYALVVPPGAPVSDIAARGSDMRVIGDAPALWQELDMRVQQSSGGAPAIKAAGVFAYEIVR